jgi:hypothetical protein
VNGPYVVECLREWSATVGRCSGHFADDDEGRWRLMLVAHWLMRLADELEGADLGRFDRRGAAGALGYAPDAVVPERRALPESGDEPTFGYCSACALFRPTEPDGTCCVCGCDTRTGRASIRSLPYLD